MESELKSLQLLSLPNTDARVYVELAARSGREEVGIVDALPFDQILKVLEAISSGLASAFKAARPSSASVELGVEFALEHGKLVGLIARGSGKANLKITLEWDAVEKGG